MGAAIAAGKSDGSTKVSEKRLIESVEGEGDAVKRPLKRAKLRDRTDYAKWRLLSDHGRQTWHYLEDDKDAKAWPQTIADKWHLGLPTVCSQDSLVERYTTNCCTRTFRTNQLQKHPSIL
jgi:hypothetical protein